VIEFFKGEKSTCISASLSTSFAIIEGGYNTFATELKSLLAQPKFTDITFIIAGKEINAHRVIVLNRCEYLKKYVKLWEIFNGDPKRVEIYNIEYYTFQPIINYLYTDQLKTAPHHIDKIYQICLKYNLPRLATLCDRNKIDSYDRERIEIPASLYVQDLQIAINNEEYSDIKFLLSDGSFVNGHKPILSSRSEYFSTIFGSSFIEGGADVITIKEVDKDVFLALLKFIYTNEIEIIQNRAVDILINAARFLLDELKQRIELAMESDISNDTVIDMLMFSDSADTPKLRKACISFVVENMEHIKTVDQFQDLRENHTLFRHIDYTHKKRTEKIQGELIEVISF